MAKYWILWKVDEKQDYTLERELLPSYTSSLTVTAREQQQWCYKDK